jgi:hypothetical protein
MNIVNMRRRAGKSVAVSLVTALAKALIRCRAVEASARWSTRLAGSAVGC